MEGMTPTIKKIKDKTWQQNNKITKKVMCGGVNQIKTFIKHLVKHLS